MAVSPLCKDCLICLMDFKVTALWYLEGGRGYGPHVRAQRVIEAWLVVHVLADVHRSLMSCLMMHRW